ncbi:sigma-70 family RNA polymerase sigma factor [Nostoc sp. FACHB-110]|uniref:sigma-70 family RNA polymerase sigma factor n=1 Tax=Nostoc sp. FACHB-110 TaxID=2692834 RepID=UPI001688892E|nr:sigma-70 family RNA polymerase sigma factor [Nostoc sp. FACHB-110]MBD2441586.1 sigma-70 family RNA polymerase sigma factor [Nostoc sp. FACHB-110]
MKRQPAKNSYSSVCLIRLESSRLQAEEDVKTELFREYRNTPTRQLRDRIFKQHHKLACEIAHQFRLCCSEPFEDLLQLATMGLLTAIERFDPERGNAFSSFACPYIKGEICHYLRDKANTIRIPRSLQSLYQKGRKLQDESMQQGIVLSPLQIATALGTTEEKWREAASICFNRLPVNIDSLLRNTAEEAPEYSTEYMKRLLLIEEQLSVCDKQMQNAVIEPLPLASLDESTRKLLEMLFFKNQPLREIRRSARASGIKAKDIKPMLLNAVLSLA